MSPRWTLMRVGRSLVTLWLLMTFTFLALNLGADAALEILGPEATEEVLADFRRHWASISRSGFSTFNISGGLRPSTSASPSAPASPRSRWWWSAFQRRCP